MVIRGLLLLGVTPSSLSDLGVRQAANSKTDREFRVKLKVTTPIGLRWASGQAGNEVFAVIDPRYRAGGFA